MSDYRRIRPAGSKNCCRIDGSQASTRFNRSAHRGKDGFASRLHCTAVRLEIAEALAWVLDCNCTLCRRYGALWCYFHGADQAKLLSQPDAALTDVYSWGDRGIAFQRCEVCGCMTHMTTADALRVTFGLNARMIPTLDPAMTSIVQMNNSHTGVFWARSETPPRTSHHPPMPKPGHDDWR